MSVYQNIIFSLIFFSPPKVNLASISLV